MKTKNRIWLCPLIVMALLILINNSCKKEPPTAIFTFSPASALVNETITFTNTSENATSYSWDFGDVGNSTSQNPTHSYSTAGTFTITLTATGDGGSSSATKTITISYPAPVASFTMDKTTANTGETITFTNTSQNAKSYSWDFGDGSSSTTQNPTHSYSTEGTFTITLTATGDGGTNSTTKSIEITKLAFNIFPGVGANNITISEKWQTVQSKVPGYVYLGYATIPSGGRSYVIHLVGSASEDMTLYILSVTTSYTLNSQDVVFIIDLQKNFIGFTEKGIMMGSSLTEVSTAYGVPETHNTTYYYYGYDSLGIDFYYDNATSKVDAMTIYLPSSKKGNDDIMDQLTEKIHELIK